jgi:signal transduction histidine kinase
MTPSERTRRAHRRPGAAATVDDELERLAERVTALEAEKAALEGEKAELEGFAAVAAHELLVPLVMTESYASMVGERLEGAEHAESREDLRAIARGAARTRMLVEALLLEARVHDRPLRRRPVNLGGLVAECRTLIAPELQERDARLEVGELPTVKGDKQLLSAVFVNLLMNAIKFSPRQGASITVGASRDPGAWRIAVRSEGPTVPVEDRERIFLPFNRASSERRVRGAGLGLTISRRVVERHGGRIGVTAANGSGQGNVFYFTLPAE